MNARMAGNPFDFDLDGIVASCPDVDVVRVAAIPVEAKLGRAKLVRGNIPRPVQADLFLDAEEQRDGRVR